MSWGAILKEEAIEFCASHNLSLPDRRIYLIGMPTGYGGQNVFLSTEFTFPEITVDEESPIKEDVIKILKSFKNDKTDVHVLK